MVKQLTIAVAATDAVGELDRPKTGPRVGRLIAKSAWIFRQSAFYGQQTTEGKALTLLLQIQYR